MNPFTEKEITGVRDLTNEQYHAAPGISKSGLDLIHKSASEYIWSKNAPRDTDKSTDLDFGTMLHSWLLEPDLIDKNYVVLPALNKSISKDKFIYQQTADQAKADGKMLIEQSEFKRLELMRESVMAHPVARKIFELDGQNETSIFWKTEFDVLAKIRPDRKIIVGDLPTIVDVKSIANMDRLNRHIYDFRYNVQQAMYQDGYRAHFGEIPDFLFLFVSTGASAGRYPVKVARLNADAVNEGWRQYREDMAKYVACVESNDWLEIETI